MKKMGKVLLFLLVLGLGIVIIDNVVFGIPGTSCRCSSDNNLEEECYFSCWPAECNAYMVWVGDAFCCDYYTCCTGVTNYCSDGNTDRYYLYNMCSTCFSPEM